jgi:hypothetical protein
MITEKTCFAELLKAELMERYGLREDQVELGLTIHTDNQALGEQILSDFSMNGGKFSLEGKTCDCAYGEHFHTIWVHSKDGRFGLYEGDNDEA